MIKLKTFWTPIMVYPDLKTGCKFVAAYTIAVSIFLIVLLTYMSNGGESTQMCNPFFEMNLDRIRLYVVLCVIFFTYMIISSLLMLKGINEDFRGLLLPWIFGMELVILFILLWSFWLLHRYHIYTNMIFCIFLYWIVAAIQFYCWLCVQSQYKKIVNEKSPHLEVVI